MANVVASILATLGLDKTGFTTGLGQAEREAQARAATIKSALGGIGLGLGVAGLSASLKSIIDYGAEVQHLSDRFQVATDAIQKFGNAAEQNGVSMESVARAFNKLEVASGHALGGSEETARAFQNLGISVSDLKTLKPEDLMEKIGRSSMNAADIVAILGRNGTELRPVLRGLAEGTIEYGKAISSIDIKRLEEADKTWKRLFENIRVFGAESVSRALEALKDVGREASYDADQVKSKWGQAGDAFKKLFTGRLSEANEEFKKLASSISGIGKGLLFPPKEAFEEKKPAGAAAAAGKFPPIGSETPDKLSAKAADQLKLTLKELAGATPPPELGGAGFTEATFKARRAIEEQAAGERERLAQHPDEAARHFQLAEQIKLDIPQLKDSEKDISGQVRAGVDSSSVFQDIKGKMDTIVNLFQG